MSLSAVGESVSKDEIVGEIETDKVSFLLTRVCHLVLVVFLYIELLTLFK